MDFPSSFKKSFKSHGSYKHSRKISTGDDNNLSHEQLPILSGNDDRRDVIVKIDGEDESGGGSSKAWLETRAAVEVEEEEEEEDPSAKLIGQFLEKQRASGGEVFLDMDLEMEELRLDNTRKSPPLAESPIRKNNSRISVSKELKVSFQDPNEFNVVEPQRIQKRYPETTPTISDSNSDSDEINEEERKIGSISFHNRVRSPSFSSAIDYGGGEVLKCTSYQRRQSMLRTKTKSRLSDLPEPDFRSGKIGKTGPLKSGLLARASGLLSRPIEEDEEDPFYDEDIPEEYKKGNLNALTILQWVSLIVIVAALVSSLLIPKWKGRKFRGLQWWKWELLVLVLICGRLVSGWGIRIAVFFIERNFLLRKRVLYFVYGVRKPVQNSIWLGLVLIAWHFLFDAYDNKEEETNNRFLGGVNRTLLCFLIGTLLWLVKTLVVKVLASSFHVSTFFDRIQESLFNQYVIETLSGPPLIEIKHVHEDEERAMAEVQKLQNAGAIVPPELRATAFSFAKSGRLAAGNGASGKMVGSGVLQKPPRTLSQKFSGASSKRQDEGILIDHLHKMNPKNISAWNMKRLVKIVRYGVLSTLDERLVGSTNGDESATQIRSEFEAKIAARKIFQNVARRGSKFIYLEDLLRFMREDESLKTMNLLGGSPESEKISKSNLKNWVVNAFRERRALALTLNDTKTAVNKLHRMVNALVMIIIVVVCLLVLGIATSRFLVFLTSQIVVVAFVFGNTCKTAFEAVIFLFVMHPFDVGDRCEIDGVQMVVEEMNILTTVFLRWDSQKIIFPNSTLSTKPIGNYYRSPDMDDMIDFYVHVATPAEKIVIMKQRITSFIENKKDHWYASPMIVVMYLEELNRVKMSVWVTHRMNHQDVVARWTRRGLVIEEMIKIFKELDMEYRLLPLDINIRSMPPINSSRMPPQWTAPNK